MNFSKDSHLRELMAFCEPQKAEETFLETLPSHIQRMGFFGMFRRPKDQALDTPLGHERATDIALTEV